MKYPISSMTVNTSNIMKVLFAESIDGLTLEELAWFARATSNAQHAAEYLSAMVEGVGCLVNEDRNEENAPGVGSFENPAKLLFSIKESLDAIAGLAHVGNVASARLIDVALESTSKKRGK